MQRDHLHALACGRCNCLAGWSGNAWRCHQSPAANCSHRVCNYAGMQKDEEQGMFWASPISSHTSATSAEHTSLDLNVQQPRGDALRQPKAHHLHARHRRGGRHFRVRWQHLRKRYMISRPCCCWNRFSGEFSAVWRSAADSLKTGIAPKSTAKLRVCHEIGAMHEAQRSRSGRRRAGTSASMSRPFARASSVQPSPVML